jgi:hypothetical protein
MLHPVSLKENSLKKQNNSLYSASKNQIMRKGNKQESTEKIDFSGMRLKIMLPENWRKTGKKCQMQPISDPQMGPQLTQMIHAPAQLNGVSAKFGEFFRYFKNSVNRLLASGA